METIKKVDEKVPFQEYMKRCAAQQFHNDMVRACFQSGISYDDLCDILNSVRFCLETYKFEIKTR